MREYVLQTETFKRLKWYHFKKQKVTGYVLGYNFKTGNCTFTKYLNHAFKFTYKQAKIMTEANKGIFKLININTLSNG